MGLWNKEGIGIGIISVGVNIAGDSAVGLIGWIATSWGIPLGTIGIDDGVGAGIDDGARAGILDGDGVGTG